MEQVVLLDEAGEATGTANKATVHTLDTQLHQGFSVYLFDDDNRFLSTRRALSKKAWPGVWTNSCCGHPSPGETFEDAVERRVADELSLQVEDLTIVLPDFRYRAVDASGIVENEYCPVFRARARGVIAPEATEVAEYAWTTWADYKYTALNSPWLISPWSVEQVAAIVAAEVDMTPS